MQGGSALHNTARYFLLHMATFRHSSRTVRCVVESALVGETELTASCAFNSLDRRRARPYRARGSRTVLCEREHVRAFTSGYQKVAVRGHVE